MDKIDELKINNNHCINLTDRNNMFITGVNKIDNFDNEEFVMDTNMGTLTIRGNSLELIKLDTIQGNISIKGKIDSFEYKDNIKKKDNQGILNRLFK